MQIKRLGFGLLAAAGSLAMAMPAFAGISFQRLNGSFSFNDAKTTSDNSACVQADFTSFQVYGQVLGNSGTCGVEIFYDAFDANKAQASPLKKDSQGTAKVSQQTQTEIEISLFDLGGTCAFPGNFVAFPDKCKVSGAVKATEGFANPDSTQDGKISLSCDLADGLSDLSGITIDQINTILAAFDARKDVKITDKGKLSIKTKGSGDDGSGCD